MATVQLNKLFLGIDVPDETTIEVRSSNGPVPTTDPIYHFDKLILGKLLVWSGSRAPRRNLMLIGNAGVGKTSLINEFAGRLGIPVWSQSCSGKTRFEHLVGTLALVNGSTEWVDGPLTAAMRNGGIFLANEISRMDPGEQMRLVDVLDFGGRLMISETGEVVIPDEKFRFACTGNSGGFGDMSGAYAGERVGSFAFGDRFVKLEISPLSADIEDMLLKKIAPGLGEPLRKGMICLANTVRKSFVGNGGNLRVSISPRALFDWALFSCEYHSAQVIKGQEAVREALFDVVLNGAPSEDVAVVLELFDNWISQME